MANIRRGGSFFACLFLHRTGIQALGIDIAIDKLDHGAGGVIAIAEAGFQHPRIAAVTILVAWADHLEELLDHRDVADFSHRLAARMQAATLAQRHQLLDDRTQILGFWQRGDDLLVLDQRGHHIAEHGAAMLRRAVELAVNLAVTHRSTSSLVFFVMPGLVPGIPLRRADPCAPYRDGRDKPGHDKGGD